LGSFLMSKYSKELKLEIVKYCIEGTHSKYEVANKFQFLVLN